MLGIPPQHLYDVVQERKPVSPTVAAKLGELFGDGAAAWLRMQAAYDAWHAEHSVDVSSIPTLDAAERELLLLKNNSRGLLRGRWHRLQ